MSRKETEPTDEHREAARELYEIAIRSKSFKEAFDGLALLLARRDEARDKRWREAVEDAAQALEPLAEASDFPGVTYRKLRALLSQPAAEEVRPFCCRSADRLGERCPGHE
jgi:hypothetical protein